MEAGQTVGLEDAAELDDDAARIVCDQFRHRGLRWLVRHEYLDSAPAAQMHQWCHGGGWSIDASVRVAD